jgi:alpha-tubulin suppressor-like RCC1 family protein
MRRPLVLSAVVVCLVTSGGPVAAQLAPQTPPFRIPAYAIDLSAGDGHTCLVNTCGAIQCWGYNVSGQGTPPSGVFTQVAAGGLHTCGLLATGKVVCWGRNVPTTGVTTFRTIEAGTFYTCGITTTGATRCWGSDSQGEATPPPSMTTRALTVSAGKLHSCGVRARTMGTETVCWGDDDDGQVSHAPQPSLLDPAAQVTTGGRHSCMLSTQGRLRCWGDDGQGQASGLGAHPSYPTSRWAREETPGVFLFPYTGWFDVSAGDSHTCALNNQLGRNNMMCWGKSDDGRTVAPAGTFQRVRAGGDHTCAIRDGGTVTCWGQNDVGQASPPALPGTCTLQLQPATTELLLR